MTRLDSMGRRVTRWSPPSERFASRITEVPAPDEFDTPCWQWDVVHPTSGYGTFHDGAAVLAHRWSYEHHVGPIPDGLVIDHLCRNRGCVNPAHLEPVTQRVNTLRGVSPTARLAAATECVNGHEFTPENTIARPGGRRGCRACQKSSAAALRQRVLAGVHRPSHCGAGHALIDENMNITPSGGITCRTCAREYMRAYRARQRQGVTS